jgi:hypothetical protein
MLPKTNNKYGGTVGRAMPGACDRHGNARAGDFQAICVSLATIAAAGCTLAFGAPHLWRLVLAH